MEAHPPDRWDRPQDTPLCASDSVSGPVRPMASRSDGTRRLRTGHSTPPRDPGFAPGRRQASQSPAIGCSPISSGSPHALAVAVGVIRPFARGSSPCQRRGHRRGTSRQHPGCTLCSGIAARRARRVHRSSDIAGTPGSDRTHAGRSRIGTSSPEASTACHRNGDRNAPSAGPRSRTCGPGHSSPQPGPADGTPTG